MPIPNPEPGLVISYAYLWHHEHQAGREEGRKDRPSVIVLAVERDAGGATVVTVLPITHRAPTDAASAVEIPSPPAPQAIPSSTPVFNVLLSSSAQGGAQALTVIMVFLLIGGWFYFNRILSPWTFGKESHVPASS